LRPLPTLTPLPVLTSPPKADMVPADALEHLVRGIVEHPDDVSVTARRNKRQRGETLAVRVHPDDMGRVIGRSGRTATALRTVVKAISGGQGVRIDFLDADER